MSQMGQENQGTGLRDVFDIVVKAPQERLLSLTFQLGESPEDNIIHALCLIVLQKEARALDKLQMLEDNFLAHHLAEKWQMSGGKLEDFGVHCGQYEEFTGESLVALARIFKVLSEQRLCDAYLRDLAYKRALSSQKASGCGELEYDQLGEEAKIVCGPQFAERMRSSKDLESGSYHDPLSSVDEGNTSLKVTLTQEQSERAHSLPSPLQATSSMPSYPTHLEISIPPTASFRDDRISQETSKLKTPVLLVSESEAKSSLQSHTSQPQTKSSEPPMFGAKKHPKTGEILAAESHKLESLITQNKTLNQTTKPTAQPNFALPTATDVLLNEMHKSEDAEEEEEEAKFKAFVIFHAPEDADMAESIRERVESAIGGKDIEGATFSGDFDIPGKSPLTCLDDAINNSAFTLLLLTRNFNTRMLEVQTDSALINSINNVHKYNTVIPLLPRENSMSRQDLPLLLKRINPLEENRSFERKIQMCLSEAKVKKQKKIWTVEQTVKKQMQRQERLKNLNQHQKQLIKECTTAQLLEKEHLSLLVEQKLLLSRSVPPGQDAGDGTVRQPNIHIENAQYIMIGNDSNMNVALRGGPDKDDSE